MIKKEGFKFLFNPLECDECKGRCCTGESGYIRTSLQEAENIANFIGMDFDEFASKALIKIGYSFSLREKSYENGFACMFFDEVNKNCSIYEVRPRQCVDFPFWDVYKEDIEEVKKECPGIC